MAELDLEQLEQETVEDTPGPGPEPEGQAAEEEGAGAGSSHAPSSSFGVPRPVQFARAADLRVQLNLAQAAVAQSYAQIEDGSKLIDPEGMGTVRSAVESAVWHLGQAYRQLAVATGLLAPEGKR